MTRGLSSSIAGPRYLSILDREDRVHPKEAYTILLRAIDFLRSRKEVSRAFWDKMIDRLFSGGITDRVQGYAEDILILLYELKTQYPEHGLFGTLYDELTLRLIVESNKRL